MSKAYRVLKSKSVALTTAATSIIGVDGYVRLYANRKFHYAFGRPATLEDTPVNVDTVELIAAVDGPISVIAAEGETDGKIWASSVALG